MWLRLIGITILVGFGVIVWASKFVSPSTPASSKVQWEFLVEDGKCTPLEKIHQIAPSVVGGSNPEEVFLRIRDQFPNSKMQRLIDVVAEDHKIHGTKPSAYENEYYKPFESDVFVIFLRPKGSIPVIKRGEIVILTDALCKRMSSQMLARPE